MVNVLILMLILLNALQGLFCRMFSIHYPGKRRNTIILFSRRFDILFLGEQIFERCCLQNYGIVRNSRGLFSVWYIFGTDICNSRRLLFLFQYLWLFWRYAYSSVCYHICLWGKLSNGTGGRFSDNFDFNGVF